MNTITVSQVNEYIKKKLDSDYLLKSVAVSGEISNYVAHSSGHSYFTLKDSSAVIKAVMFKGHKEGLRFVPKDGMKVIAMGSVSAYPRDGMYRLYVSALVSTGTGDLFAAYEALKKKLFEEGIFDESLKRPVPEFPEKIGVITSETGAVLHDIQNVVSRRWPLTEIILYPAMVQGEGGADTVIDALYRLNRDGFCDVAIIARGGGSIEELWEFNSEKLARAIRLSDVPVVSAVGHETDYTICDFASDMRAPTPSAAAELCVPSADDVRLRLDSLRELLCAAMKRRTDVETKRLALCGARLRNGAKGMLASGRHSVDMRSSALRSAYERYILLKKAELSATAAKLESVNPLSVLSKGYGAVLKNGSKIRLAAELKQRDKIEIIMADGRISASVEEVNINEI